MIRDLYKKGVSISEISRETGRDRKTIRKLIDEPLLVEPKVRQRKVRKIDPYVPYLENRISEGVLNARKLYGEIVRLGYPGKETMVRSFVQAYRVPKAGGATVRFETAPGEQAQVDWGHFGSIQHHGRRRKLYGFILTLGWSRAMYLAFTVSMDIGWWLRCHLQAFHYLGGVPQQLLHDNLKTAVLGRTSGGRIEWNARYLDFAEYYGFRPRACQPYRAQTKGKVENGVRYVRGNFWVGLRYRDLADLNNQALGWLNNVANVRIHGTTGEVPFERLPHEQLASLQGRPDYDTSLITYRRSSRDCLISYGGNFYSVPAAYSQQRLLVKETATAVLSICTPEGDEIARHRVAMGKGERITIDAHYAGIRTMTTTAYRTGALQVATTADPLHPLVTDAPQVEARPLSSYEQLLEVSHE